MADCCYIGIDTSNYTTSVAIADEAGQIIANLKAPLPVKSGERGLRQSDAVFAHVKNLPELMRTARQHLREYTPAAIGVSATPRDAEGSYMPCFLSGLAAAYSMAAGADLSVYRFSHQNGHIMAALYGASAGHLIGRPFGAFHVSGGTTEMLLIEPNGTDFSVKMVGGSADLNAGQAVDRIGVAMGLSFPCGPALEELARSNCKKVPKPRICVRGGECNLSGLENAALRLYQESGDAALTAAYVLDFIADTLSAMATWLRESHGPLPLLFAGGVMSNRIIADKLTKALGDAYFSLPAFSADNAAGIALLCRAKAQNN